MTRLCIASAETGYADLHDQRTLYVHVNGMLSMHVCSADHFSKWSLKHHEQNVAISGSVCNGSQRMAAGSFIFVLIKISVAGEVENCRAFVQKASAWTGA